ncbi:transcriptional regulator [Brumimicrobium salinarum]|uniref:Transcriptional regulator n=1 Tax=Brumimicrobium salinarum TaxID=2058658 RepID=A0A2I0QZ66_9FLAO|nr:Rrf2 family transcriptional regulator [Brumimicrobium salinarum]PKR79625.1 transcriptional regulator [Brumimicrobium salinarum]
MLSKKTKYGIKALTYICRHRELGPIPIATIAEKENISHKFLETILLLLRKGGILSSKKGKGGGYYLRKDPEEIWMSDVIRLLSGPIAMVPCVSLNYYEKCDDCPDEETCGTNRLMLEVRDSTLKVLKGKSLAQLTMESSK